MSKNKHRKKKYSPPILKSKVEKPSFFSLHTKTIKLTNLHIGGFAGTNALPGETLPILVRALLTSDEQDFHIYAEEIGRVLTIHGKEAGIILSLDSFVGFFLVIHRDGTAELYLDNIQMVVEALVKHDIKAGQVVYGGDIADIRKIRYPDLNLLSSDKVFTCFKVGWKFGMFFDLADNRELNIDRMERDLGVLYRRLRYQGLYGALADKTTVEKMTKAGWFPFIEIIGGDVDPLLKAYQSEFDIENKEKQLVEKFTPDRIDKIGERWWKNPVLSKHKTVLEAGLKAFKRGDSLSCIKDIMTEIEGILAHVHLVEKGSAPKTEELLKYAVERGIKKAGGEATLFFPADFLKYLLEVTYASFNRNTSTQAEASRHTVGHGFASGDTYTPARALQVILTLDQIVFYL